MSPGVSPGGSRGGPWGVPQGPLGVPRGGGAQRWRSWCQGPNKRYTAIFSFEVNRFGQVPGCRKCGRNVNDSTWNDNYGTWSTPSCWCRPWAACQETLLLESSRVMLSLFTGDARQRGVQHLCQGCCAGALECAAKMADAVITTIVELIPDKLGSTNKHHSMEQAVLPS